MGTMANEVFLTLEEALARRVRFELGAAFEAALTEAQAAISRGEFDKARALVDGLTSIPTMTALDQFVETKLVQAALFGASQFVDPEDSVLIDSADMELVRSAKKQFALQIEDGVASSLKLDAQRLISRIEAGQLEALDESVVENVVIYKAAADNLADKWFSLINGKKNALADMGANLSTSRLIQFGFLAEAQAQGAIKYQVSEILDTRTCPFCRRIHGKTFHVKPAAERLDRVLRILDPKELKETAPFPRQDKKGLAAFDKMTNKEMQARGFNSPPYHPFCRGMLVKIGTVRRDDVRAAGLAVRPARVPRPKPVKAPDTPEPRVTSEMVNGVTDARQNGYAIRSDLDGIEDQNILFAIEKDVFGNSITTATFKVRNVYASRLQKSIKASSSTTVVAATSEALTTELGAINRTLDSFFQEIDRVAVSGNTLGEGYLVRGRKLQKRLTTYISQLNEVSPAAAVDLVQQMKPVFLQLRKLDDQMVGRILQPDWNNFKSHITTLRLPKTTTSVTTVAKGQSWLTVQNQRFQAKRINNGFAQEVADLVESSETGTFEMTGKTYLTKVGDAEVSYYPPNKFVQPVKASYKENSMTAFYNRVTVRVAGDGREAMEKVFLALDDLGLDHKAPSPVQREALYLRQIANQTKSRSSVDQILNSSATPLSQRVAAVKAQLREDHPYLTVNIDQLPDYNPAGTRDVFNQGGITFVNPLVRAHPEWEVFHSNSALFHAHTSDGSLTDAVKAILNSGGQMASTTDKLRRGLNINGMSPSSDLGTGGADYFFTRLWKKVNVDREGFVWRTNKLNRTDTISYKRDLYGETSSPEYISTNRIWGHEDWDQTRFTVSNETIFKKNLSLFDDLEAIVTRDASMRDDIIQTFRSAGINEWPDGRSLREVVMTQSDYNASVR